MAALGPAFLTVTVNTTLVPMVGVGLSTDLVSDRSAVPAGDVARDASSSSPFPMPLLGVESGSFSLAAVICAE